MKETFIADACRSAPGSDRWTLGALESHHAKARGANAVALVDPDRQHRHALDGAGRLQFAGVDWTQARDLRRQLEGAGAGGWRIAADELVAIERLVEGGERGGGEGLEGRGHADVLGQETTQVLARGAFGHLYEPRDALLERHRDRDVDEDRSAPEALAARLQRRRRVGE